MGCFCNNVFIFYYFYWDCVGRALMSFFVFYTFSRWRCVFDVSEKFILFIYIFLLPGLLGTIFFNLSGKLFSLKVSMESLTWDIILSFIKRLEVDLLIIQAYPNVDGTGPQPPLPTHHFTTPLLHGPGCRIT